MDLSTTEKDGNIISCFTRKDGKITNSDLLAFTEKHNVWLPLEHYDDAKNGEVPEDARRFKSDELSGDNYIVEKLKETM